LKQGDLVLAKIEEYRSLFMTGSLILILIAAYPTLVLFIRLPSSSEKFSELWLLGLGHMAEDYPFNVTVNEDYHIYVAVANHRGYSTYYRVYVKFHNQTQSLPLAFNSTPSPSSALYELSFFVRDDEIWEALLNFKILDFESSNELMTVNNMSINGVLFLVNNLSIWDAERNGFYYQLFFELWQYNITSQEFQFYDHNWIWLNMTA